MSGNVHQSDPTKLRAQVDVVSGGTAGKQYDDGAARGTATGTLAMGDDGANIQSLKVDASGQLQVAIVSGGSSGTQYADGAARGTATGTLAMGDDGANIQSLKCDANGVLAIQDNGGAVTVDGTLTGITNVVHIDDNAGAITVDGTITAVTAITNALPAGNNNIGDVDVASIAAGNNNIGDVDVASIAAGDNNIGNVDVVTLPALAAGSALIGKVGIDQTTPGTTNRVDVGAALPAGTNAIGKLAANSGVDIGDIDVTSIAAGDNNIGNVDIVTMPVGHNIIDSGTVTTLTGITNVVHVDDNAGALTVDQGTAASLKCEPAGNVAADAQDSGNPIKIGGVAYNFDGTAPGTAVAELDRSNLISDVYGRQFVETTHPNYWTVSADYAAAQTNVSVKATPGAGLSLYITDVLISNGATAGNITLLDGSGGTVKLELYPGINGGCVTNLRTSIKLTANTALCMTSTTVTTHSLTICGFIAP